MTTETATAAPVVAEPRVRERVISGIPGPAMLPVGVLFVLGGITLQTLGSAALSDKHGVSGGAVLTGGVVLLVLGVLTFGGLTAIVPGQARVVQLFGRYVGTARVSGLRWFNPLTRRRKVSVRIRNHETAVTKVNDADGNPIEIAAVVVWQVIDTAAALYEVDDFVQFVNIQAETAVRHIATSYPYDAHTNPDHRDTAQLSLRDNAEEITGKLSAEIGERVTPAGVGIIESRLTRLAYAPEIAQAMLRRQQASAVIDARQRIVQGAVGMVRQALAELDEQNVVELDEERKAAMVSNLLVVLCGDRDTQPIVNAGSLYH